MRKRFAIALVAFVGMLPWIWFKPQPGADVRQAELISVLDLEHDEDWFGGVSGIEVSDDGNTLYLATDRGYRAEAVLTRSEGVLSGFAVQRSQPYLDENGVQREFPHTDGEGLALAPDGTMFVSFEHAHRILFYRSWESQAEWPGYTYSWRALAGNQGMEALAVDDDGTVYTLPEGVFSDATEALVYRRRPMSRWEQPFTIPVDSAFKPVGADFGPDGRFYLLERGLYPFGFYSRVRSMTLNDTGANEVITELETPLGRHGNLEGLSVWRDSDGLIRLTMVSDDNFLPFMRSQLVEYRVRRGVAQAEQ